MHRLYPRFVGGPGAVGLLLVRLVVGAAFLFHGWPKIQNPFGWMGDAPIPGVLQAAAAVAEFGGGLSLILGLLTPLFAFLLACTMAFATFLVHMQAGDPFVFMSTPERPFGPSYEPAAVYLVVAILMILVGPGMLSLDYLLFGKRRPAANLWRDAPITQP
jgi:putative oxidoreductase